MIGFLFGRRWRDRGRLLFHYHDGRRRRSIDPLATWQALESHARYRHSRDFADAMSGHEDKQAAAVDAVCGAFDVESYSDMSGKGMTIAERLALLVAFDAYATELQVGLGLSAIGRQVPTTIAGEPIAPAAQPTEIEA